MIAICTIVKLIKTRQTPRLLLGSTHAVCSGAGAAARPQDGEGRDGADEGDGGHLQRGRRGGPPGDQPEHALGHVTTSSPLIGRAGRGLDHRDLDGGAVRWPEEARRHDQHLQQLQVSIVL